ADESRVRTGSVLTSPARANDAPAAQGRLAVKRLKIEEWIEQPPEGVAHDDAAGTCTAEEMFRAPIDAFGELQAAGCDRIRAGDDEPGFNGTPDREVGTAELCDP